MELKITVERLDDHYDIMAISKETLYVCKTERCSANGEMLLCLNVTFNIAAKKKTKKHAEKLEHSLMHMQAPLQLLFYLYAYLLNNLLND